MTSSGDTGDRKADPFRFARLALAVIGVHALLLIATPPNPVRAAFALAALFGVGYCALGLVFGGRVPLTPAELLAFTIGFMIVTVGGGALLLSSQGIPFGDWVITGVGLPVSILATLRVPWTRPSLRDSRAFLTGFVDLGEYSRGERAIVAVLLVAVLTTTVVLLAVLYAATYPDVLSPAIAITGPDGQAASLPTAFVRNETKEIIVYALGGSTADAFTLAVRLVPANATGVPIFHDVPWASPLRLDPFGEARKDVTLEARGTWSERLTIAVVVAGTYTLHFELIDGASASVASSFLTISVSG